MSEPTKILFTFEAAILLVRQVLYSTGLFNLSAIPGERQYIRQQIFLNFFNQFGLTHEKSNLFLLLHFCAGFSQR